MREKQYNVAHGGAKTQHEPKCSAYMKPRCAIVHVRWTVVHLLKKRRDNMSETSEQGDWEWIYTGAQNRVSISRLLAEKRLHETVQEAL